MANTRTGWVALLLSVACFGCLEKPVGEPTVEPALDGGRSGTAALTVRITDARGRTWSKDAAPRRPVFVIHSPRGFAQDREVLFLLAGGLDPDLEDDLRSFPLEAKHTKRAVRSMARVAEMEIELRPSEALVLGGDYVLALGGWAEDATGLPLLPDDRSLSTAVRIVRTEGGAVPIDTWPPDGAGGIPTMLPVIAVRFDDALDPMQQEVRIEAAGDSIALEQSNVPCAEIGWPSGYCVLLEPMQALAPSTLHRIVVDERVLDHTGAAVGPWAAEFQTGPDASSSFAWAALTCSVDERIAGDFCVLASDDTVSVRVKANEPARFWLMSPYGSTSAVASRGTATLSLSHVPADRAFEGSIRAVDLAGTVHEREIELASAPELAPLFITEVRANPRGPEPKQEYVEVLNSGPVAIDLQGFSISDRADDAGDVIERAVSLPPFTRALIVADQFDPEHEADDPVPPGVLLVPIGTSIATAGLLNAGEPLYLRDREGNRLSAAPAMPPPRPGVCIVRVGEDGRSGEPDAFAYDAEDGCTPGREDRVPSP